MFSQHVTKDISAYCHGELSSAESKQFAEHIISCVKCRTEFEEVKLGIKLAEQLPKFSAPDYLWTELEPLLARQTPTTSGAQASRYWSWQMKAAAAAVLLLVSSWGVWLVYTNRSYQIPTDNGKPAWFVKRLDGAPTIGNEKISNNGQL